MATAKNAVRALVEWVSSESGGRKSPPSGIGQPYRALVRVGEWRGDLPDEANFSLVIELVEKLDPNRWKAKVGFLVEDAPHQSLQAGATFEVYEGRRCVARGKVE